jgi:hypothetical protein
MNACICSRCGKDLRMAVSILGDSAAVARMHASAHEREDYSRVVAALRDTLNRLTTSGGSRFTHAVRCPDPAKDGPAFESYRALLAEIARAAVKSGDRDDR